MNQLHVRNHLYIISFCFAHTLKVISIYTHIIGADVNMKTVLGRTPLHVSAAQNRGSIVDVLLNSGTQYISESIVIFTHVIM